MPNQHTQGILFGIGGMVILSPDSLMLRLMNCDDYAVITMRAAFAAVTIIALLAYFPTLRSGFRRQPMVWYGVLFAAGLISFPLSVNATHVANTLVILAATPIFAALGARLFLREKTAKATWLTAIIIFFGILVLLSGNIGKSGLVGDLLALFTALTLAGNTLIIRRYHTSSFIPGLAIGATLAALLTAGFADWQTVQTKDLSLAAVNGCFVIAASFFLIVAAAKRLPPAEVNLLFLLETALGPLWVWWVLDETPPDATITAALLIMPALAIYGVWSYRQHAAPGAN